MIEVVINAVISALTVLLGYYVISKKAEKIVEKTKIELKDELEDWLNSENGQKALFSIGALIGNGAKSGFGLNARSGKYKPQDLLAQIAAQFIQQKLLNQPGQKAGGSSGSTNLNIT